MVLVGVDLAILGLTRDYETAVAEGREDEAKELLVSALTEAIALLSLMMSFLILFGVYSCW